MNPIGVFELGIDRPRANERPYGNLQGFILAPALPGPNIEALLPTN